MSSSRFNNRSQSKLDYIESDQLLLLQRILKQRNQEIENLKAILSYMQISLDSRENMIRQYTEENFSLRDKIKSYETLIKRLKQTRFEKKETVQDTISLRKTHKFMLKGNPRKIIKPIKSRIQSSRDASKMRSSVPDFKKVVGRTGNINLVTNNYSNNKTIDTLMTTEASSKTIVLASREEIMEIINSSPVVKIIRECSSNPQRYLSKIDSMDDSEIREHLSQFGEVVSESKKIINMFCKVRDIVNGVKSLSTIVQIQEMFDWARQAISMHIDCEEAEIYMYDEVCRELWTYKQIHKIEVIKKSGTKGILGYVCRTMCPLKIDEAYADPRFEKDADQGNSYRTKSLIIVPIKNESGDKIIGICQAINKLGDNPFTFDDEGMLEIFAQLAGKMLHNYVEKFAMMNNFSKAKRVIEIGVECISSDSPKQLQSRAENFLKDLMNISDANIWFLHEDHIYRYFGDHVVIQESKLGLVGKAISVSELYLSIEPKKHQNYHQHVDIDTELPLITAPIIGLDGITILGALQVKHVNSVFASESFTKEEFEQEMIEIFCKMLAGCISQIIDRTFFESCSKLL